jgi:hypothetical protein
VLIHYEWNLYKRKELQICFIEVAFAKLNGKQQDGR